MAKEARTGEEQAARAEVVRCELCSRPIDDGEHPDGVCNFYKGVRLMAIAANGRIEAF